MRHRAELNSPFLTLQQLAQDGAQRAWAVHQQGAGLYEQCRDHRRQGAGRVSEGHMYSLAPGRHKREAGQHPQVSTRYRAVSSAGLPVYSQKRKPFTVVYLVLKTDFASEPAQLCFNCRIPSDNILKVPTV